jgi:hypothetical protein
MLNAEQYFGQLSYASRSAIPRSTFHLVSTSTLLFLTQLCLLKTQVFEIHILDNSSNNKTPVIETR